MTTSRATAAVLRPEDWPNEFVDGAVALYAPDAHFQPPEVGDPLLGQELIRPVLADLIAARTRLRSRVVRSVVVADVALLYTDFEGTKVGASGVAVVVRSKAVEVLRRRPAGD